MFYFLALVIFFLFFFHLIKSYNINYQINDKTFFPCQPKDPIRKKKNYIKYNGKRIILVKDSREENSLDFKVEDFLCESEKKGKKKKQETEGSLFFQSNTTFSELNIHKNLIENLKNHNINTPSVIQYDLLKYYDEHKDDNLQNIIIAAENGIGKTLSYIIFLINHILKKGTNKNTCTLILQYNNLLCNQCYDILKKLSKNVKAQIINLKYEGIINIKNHLIVICTPVRLMTYIKEDKENIFSTFFENLDFFIMDEVDILFDNPYIKNMKIIFDELNKLKNEKYVSIITSSTLCNRGKKSIYNNVIKYITNPIVIKTNYFHNIHPFINYHFIKPSNYNIKNKIQIIKHILLKENYKKVLIFCNTLKSSNTAFSLLKLHFDNIFLFNSTVKKEDQSIILNHFKTSQNPILVTTDIIYRGIDISDISHLFHFDTPTNIVVYTHRNGRLARGANTGHVYIFKHFEDLVTRKIYELHKNKLKFEEIFSRKRSLRKNYKRELQKKK
ncbi:putative ATP-dependent helicase [Plasmodium gaboni]|uniref:ATP-dependent RNA helicase n=1 Tax=Plasmodium gaboni TaxID=647221 RepID=A0A151LSS1_9APIC|nr:putative ATP-dependent helicase [Plasmodium gaboni]KYO02238.1 putative ATP-dependent helicase [Plasmodium gaboni]